ncbi:MAG: alpha/beta hydrolase [Desulfobacteraceae bacterium]
MAFAHFAAGFAALYLGAGLAVTYIVHRFPRRPVQDKPDWGRITDTRIPCAGDGSLEVWRIEPSGESRGTVVLAHGWSRNRGRMVERARTFGDLGYTTVIHSARDHGGSTRHPLMNALRFAEDIESVLCWVGRPVLLYGHSAGAAAAVIAAYRNPGRITHLFLEGCYARTRKALMKLYCGYHPLLAFFSPAILGWMEIFYRGRLDSISPARLAPDIDLPVLLIHGDKDERFPLEFMRELRDAFPARRAEVFIACGSGHSSSSLNPGYKKAVAAFLQRHSTEGKTLKNMNEPEGGDD